MKIELKKFGTTLSSRPAGEDARKAIAGSIKQLDPDEVLVVDFEGVLSFSPSWGDEFLTPLLEDLGDRLLLEGTNSNLSVKATLDLLEEISGQAFIRQD